jgi:hypothetical protein
MVRRSPLLPFTIAAILLTMCAGARSAGTFNDVRSVSGEPPPGATTWILVSKPPKKHGRKIKGYPGLQLHASLVVEVIPAFNPTTQASGHIAEPDRCDAQHYHGTLFEIKDPWPRACGWGKVIPFNDAPESVIDLSAAITREERAEIKALSGDIAGAITDLTDAAADVEEALDHEPELGEGDWDSGDSRRYAEALHSALNFDAAATGVLNSAKNEPDPQKKKKKVNNAVKGIEEALKDKRSALLRVVKALDLGEDDD